MKISIRNPLLKVAVASGRASPRVTAALTRVKFVFYLAF